MTIRANSLRSVLVDGGFLLVAMALVALASSVAYSQAEATDLRPDPRTTDDSIDSRQNTDDNPPSGDPTESEEAANQSMILGMKVEADEQGRAIVKEVAAASPAWDAGIREGDEIIELHSLKPGEMEYAKWDQDLRRMIRNTQDGQAVPVEVSRDGERISLRVKLPESRVAAVREARQEEQELAKLAQAQQQGQIQPGQGQGQDRIAEYGSDPYGRQAQPYGPGWGGGGVGVIADDGTAGGSGNNRAATNAVAELHATSTLNTGTGNVAGGAAQQVQGGQGGRVGMAVFQNGQQGVAAHVEVHGLPQGNYRVGIGDGGSGTGFVNPFDNSQTGEQLPGDGRSLNDDDAAHLDQQSQPGQDPRMNQPGQFPQQGTQPGTPLGPQNQNNGVAPGTFPGNDGTPAPGGAAPIGVNPGQSGSLAAPGGAAYLAQHFDAPAAQPGAQPTGQPGNRNAPASGNANAPRSGNVNNQQPMRDAAGRQPGQMNGGLPGQGGVGGGAMPNFLMEIGMLQIGPNGSGQVQNQLEGVRVQDLAGMTVAVVPAMAQTGNPAAGANQPGVDPRGVNRQGEGQNPGAIANPQANGNQRGTALPGGANDLGGNAGSFGPVAMGVIRIIERRGLPQQEPTDAYERMQQRGQEANAREREQLQRRDLTTPPDQTFDPNQPRN